MYQQIQDEEPEPTVDWSPLVVIGSIIGAACVIVCLLKCCTGCHNLCKCCRNTGSNRNSDDDIFELV